MKVVRVEPKIEPAFKPVTIQLTAGRRPCSGLGRWEIAVPFLLWAQKDLSASGW